MGHPKRYPISSTRGGFYNNPIIPSAIAVRMMQHDVAPASSTPLERSPRRLERPNLATKSFVQSRPTAAASFIFSNVSLKSAPASAPAFNTSTAGESVSTNVLSPTCASTIS